MAIELGAIELMLRDLEAQGRGKEGEKVIGWAILAVAEQLDRMATIAETWAKQPK